MQKPKYKIPKNLCQSCYESGGRFIMDCYCIICEQCFQKYPPKHSQCSLCLKQTKGNKIDTKNEKSINKISHLFENVDTSLTRILEISKFQTEIANRYCQHLEKKLEKYQSAVAELIVHNPNLFPYFNARVKLGKNVQTQCYDRNCSIGSTSVKELTIKPKRQYHSEMYEYQKSYTKVPDHRHEQEKVDMNGVRAIHRNSKQNFSGNAVYKVPNLNYNTAIRSSKRSAKEQKLPSNRDQQHQYFRGYRRNM